MVGEILALGFDEVALYYPTVDSQRAVFEQVASEIIPELRQD